MIVSAQIPGMSSKKVQCKFCDTRVSLTSMKYHVGAVCPDAIQKCKWCNEKVKRKFVPQHLEESHLSIIKEITQPNERKCDKKDTTQDIASTVCEYCSQKVCLNDIGYHVKMLCPEKMTDCGRCGVKLRKKILAKHLEEKCPGSKQVE